MSLVVPWLPSSLPSLFTRQRCWQETGQSRHDYFFTLILSRAPSRNHLLLLLPPPSLLLHQCHRPSTWARPRALARATPRIHPRADPIPHQHVHHGKRFLTTLPHGPSTASTGRISLQNARRCDWLWEVSSRMAVTRSVLPHCYPDLT